MQTGQEETDCPGQVHFALGRVKMDVLVVWC